MVPMTSEAITPGSPVDLFQFSSDSEDYDPLTRRQTVAVFLGTAFLAVPAGLICLAVVPFILGARAVRELVRTAGVTK